MPRIKLVPATNHLIAALPRRDRERFLVGCELVELAFSENLAEPGRRIHHVYFPVQSLISLVKPLDSYGSQAMSLVGDEGMVGTPLVLGVDIWPLHALVQGPGSALRMSAETFRQELKLSPALQHLMNRYIHVLMGQFAQTAACTGFHVVEARLARWLLMTQDRAHADTFHITHEFLANMLGVRRVGVTKAACSLQIRKLISYRRGDITILDRDGLEAASCECYGTDKAAHAEMLG